MEDVAAILALERRVAEAPHWQEEEYRAMVAARSDGSIRRCLLVAAATGGLVGFAVGKQIETVGEAELESVVVDVSARRAGVGRALCEEVISWCKDVGATSLELEVRAGNAGAQALYRQLGFVEVGRRPAYYREPVEDAILMRLGEMGYFAIQDLKGKA